MAEMQGGHEYWIENQDQQTSYSVRSSVEGDVNLFGNLYRNDFET